MEVRGSVNDRPWGMTLGAIALRRHTGQLTVEAEGKRYCIAFQDGAIVAATSPLAADAIARVALTNHFITSTQVSDITRRIAASPDRDEIDVLAETIRFSPEQVAKLRHRVVAQRAARTFSLEQGDFILDDQITLPVIGGVAVDHRHIIYLGVRTNLSEQRLIDDLRQLGSFFVLKPEAVDELPRFGFDTTADPVLEALKVGTSLPELEASHREVDPRTAQAVIYALVSCTACVIPPRTATPQPRAAAAGRRITQPITSPAARTATRGPATSRTSTRRDPGTPADAPLASRTATRPRPRVIDPSGPASGPEREAPVARTSTPPPGPPSERATPPGAPSTLTPFAAAVVTFQNQSPPKAPTTPPAVARSTTAPYSASRTTSSPFASRTSTASPTSYSTTAFPDEGTNTPAATRPRAQSDPGSARTSTPTVPVAARAATRSTAVATPPGRITATRTAAPLPAPDPAAPEPARVDTDEGVKFVETPTPTPALGGSRPGTTEAPARAPSPRPAISRVATPLEFADQRTPGFGDQRTPADQRTPTDRRFAADQRTPTEPPFSRTPTGTPTGAATGAPMTGRVSTDNAAAAEQAFKRGEAAMKRDQPGEAILEFKAACDLNPGDVDYAGMLAWAKFCAAGDKPGIGSDTRKALERAVFKSHRPERARFYLGRVERMLGRDKEALRHFQEVLDLKPNHADAASEIRAIEARLAAASKSGGLFGRKR
jgi:hypothetical protein